MTSLPTSGSAPSVADSVPVLKLMVPTPKLLSEPRRAPLPSSVMVYQCPPDR
jgi:hypothetical protein